uniref:Uncharacterized protein n=1 Tax=Myotis lucifugus TaxID=59463 RepID=G1Q925_MYOLU
MKSPASSSSMLPSVARMRCTVCRTLVAMVTSPQTNMWPRSRHSTRCTSAASSVRRMS